MLADKESLEYQILLLNLYKMASVPTIYQFLRKPCATSCWPSTEECRFSSYILSSLFIPRAHFGEKIVPTSPSSCASLLLYQVVWFLYQECVHIHPPPHLSHWSMSTPEPRGPCQLGGPEVWLKMAFGRQANSAHDTMLFIPNSCPGLMRTFYDILWQCGLEKKERKEGRKERGREGVRGKRGSKGGRDHIFLLIGSSSP